MEITKRRAAKGKFEKLQKQRSVNKHRNKISKKKKDRI